MKHSNQALPFLIGGFILFMLVWSYLPKGRKLTREEIEEKYNSWKSPRGLAEIPSPRGLRPIWRVLGVFGIVPVLLSVFFGGIAYFEFKGIVLQQKRYDVLMVSGVEGNAKIVHKRMDSGARTTLYFIDYSFEANYREFQDIQQIDQETYDNFSEGQLLSIVYLPSNPALHRLAFLGRPAGMILPILLSCLSLAFGLTGVLGVGCEWLALRFGEIRGGVVTSYLWSAKGQKKICYSFRDLQGVVRSSSQTRPQVSCPNVGKTVTVFYLRRFPWISAVYPGRVFRIEGVSAPRL